MSARNRSLSHSRLMIWLLGLVIQLKRGGLAVRRAFLPIGQALAKAIGILLWPMKLPAIAMRCLWPSFFRADEERNAFSTPPRDTRPEHLVENSAGRGKIHRLAIRSTGMLRKTAQVSRIQFQRAELRARKVFHMRSAWTFATVTGTLGLVLMILLQVMYSFQILRAKEPAPAIVAPEERPKTRIDPGLPQGRESETSAIEVAQSDPFAPLVDPFALPAYEPAPQVEPVPQEALSDPLKNLPPIAEPAPYVDSLDNPPPVEPAPPASDQQPVVEPEPFVDPLDNWPAFGPTPLEEASTVQPAPEEAPAAPPSSRSEPELFIDPLDNWPAFGPATAEPQPPALPEADPSTPPSLVPMKTDVPTEPLPNELPPLAQESVPELPGNPFPAAAPSPTMPNPPKNEPEPFIDPLDNLPPFNPAPREEPPAVDPTPQEPSTPPAENPPRNEPEPFIDPLDNLPPFNPAPQEELPAVDPTPQEPITPPVENPPRNEPEPFIDPLDNLPPFKPMPREESPVVEPVPAESSAPLAPRNEPDPFVDPLDNLPPFNPVPMEPEPAPKAPQVETPGIPPSSVDVGIGFLRMPEDDEERFLLKSGAAFHKEILSREVRMDAWEQYWKDQRPASPRPYWERLSPDERRRLERDLIDTPARTEYDPGPEPTRTNLNVGIEKHLPSKGTAHEPLKYEIIVENRGREMIDAVDVDEAVPSTHLLTGVSPAGYFESDLLRWKLRELRPGEKRRLSVEVVPTETGTIETTTSVRPSTRVGSLTEVEKSDPKPKAYTLRLRRSGYRTVGLEERVLFTNHVQNLSKTAQRDLKIVEQVPGGYQVVRVENWGVYDRQNHTITWTLGELPAGETAKLGVHLKAESTGELMTRVKGHSREGEAVPIRARVRVDSLRTERITTPVSLETSPGRCPKCGEECCCPSCRCR